MDVTSLLNLKAQQQQQQHQQHYQQPTPLRTTSVHSESGISTTTSGSLSTPSPDTGFVSRRASEQRVTRRRMPWDAGGYSLPLTLDNTKLPMHSSNPMLQRDSPFDRSTSGSSYDLPSETSHSRASSMSSTCFDMSTSNNATPITSTHPGR